MIQQNKIYIFLSKRAVCFWSAGIPGYLMPASKPHHAERAVELRSVWSAPDVVLFLEFPFTLNHFEFTISLSPNELQSYSQKAFVVSRRSRKKSRKFSAKNTG